MTHDDIRTLYHNADYSKPKLLQVLADVAGITAAELKIIIKAEDEKDNMKWTDEQREKYDRLSKTGMNTKELAAAVGVPRQAIYDQRANKKLKVKKAYEIINDEPAEKMKAATINEDFDAKFPKVPMHNNTYPDCAPDELPADEQPKKHVPEINKEIAKLCEEPDPKTITKADVFAKLGIPELSYADSLIETLREEIEGCYNYMDEQDKVIKLQDKLIETNSVIIGNQDKIIQTQGNLIIDYQRKDKTELLINRTSLTFSHQPATMFTRAHETLNNLEEMIKMNGFTPEKFDIKSTGLFIMANAYSADNDGDYVMIRKNYKTNIK